MAAIKESSVGVGHYVPSEANSPEPSAPPDASGYPEINPSPTELLYPHKNPCAFGPLSMELLDWGQALASLPAWNDGIVTQRWQKCREAVMDKGDLAVITGCPVIYALNQHLASSVGRTFQNVGNAAHHTNSLATALAMHFHVPDARTGG